MPITDLSVSDVAGSAVARADPERATATPIDWRQLSHELRTPLNAILGNTELLLDGSAGPLSAHARACLGEVQTAGHQLLRQVQRLLAWSELCAKRPKLAECWVDLIALIRGALIDARADALRIEPHNAALVIRGDRFWLQMLAAEIIALPGPSRAVPTIALESSTHDRALRFIWPDFGAGPTDALQRALIERIAQLQGAAVVSNADGLSLHWPMGQLDLSAAIASDPEPEAETGAERCREPARSRATPLSRPLGSE
jgi:phospho-acceptor domain-containing protein